MDLDIAGPNNNYMKQFAIDRPALMLLSSSYRVIQAIFCIMFERNENMTVVVSNLQFSYRDIKGAKNVEAKNCEENCL